MVVEATTFENHETKENCHFGQALTSESCRTDCIYDDEPSGFKKDPMNSNNKIQAQDPLEEIDLGDRTFKIPTYISAKV